MKDHRSVILVPHRRQKALYLQSDRIFLACCRRRDIFHKRRRAHRKPLFHERVGMIRCVEHDGKLNGNIRIKRAVLDLSRLILSDRTVVADRRAAAAPSDDLDRRRIKLHRKLFPADRAALQRIRKAAGVRPDSVQRSRQLTGVRRRGRNSGKPGVFQIHRRTHRRHSPHSHGHSEIACRHRIFQTDLPYGIGKYKHRFRNVSGKSPGVAFYRFSQAAPFKRHLSSSYNPRLRRSVSILFSSLPYTCSERFPSCRCTFSLIILASSSFC